MKEELLESRMGIALGEKKILEDASEFFKREFASNIHVWQEGDKVSIDPKEKARFAEPYRPAIFVE